jgi:hypothetical protein
VNQWRRNADYPWETFDPLSYQSHNYAALRDDDRRILELMRNHFVEAQPPPAARGIDIGCGPNLYPALAMLPFCADITLLDYAPSNVQWLRTQLDEGYRPSWDAFWQVLREQPRYATIADPRSRLRTVAHAEAGSVFDLPAGLWDIGTMFFVAESITGEPREFRDAVHGFVGALKPGAPFAAAFMADSQGSRAGAMRLPAVPVGPDDVAACLDTVAGDLRVERVTISGEPLRAGYDGMIVATGRAVGF